MEKPGRESRRESRRESSKIVIACDSFKGSLTSEEAGFFAARGIKRILPEAEVGIIPIADGGEGTLDVLARGGRGEKVSCTVSDPLGRDITSSYIIIGGKAVIEVAEACGLTLLSPEERDPRFTTSRGVGQLIIDAMNRGCTEILVGLGGSAINDGGTGMLRAFGFRFLDEKGEPIEEGGLALSRLASIESRGEVERLKKVKFTVAVDVSNPLTGPLGASLVFSRQKGADETTAVSLDKAMENFAGVTTEYFGEDLSRTAGAGAAGGLGYAFRAFLDAETVAGIDMILDTVDFDAEISDADLVITGEGKMDSQTLGGKAPVGVLKRCLRANIPVVAICGGVQPEAKENLIKAGFKDIIAVTPEGTPLEEAMRHSEASRNVELAGEKIARKFKRRYF